MDQGADRRGTFHGIRQPDMERELGGFTHSAGEDTDRGPGQSAASQSAADSHVLQRHRVKGAGVAEEKQDCRQETEITQPGDDESLLCGIGGLRFVEPEPDEQVTAQAHHLPEDEHHQQVPGEHQPKHRGGEQGHPGIIARKAGIDGIHRVAVQVAKRIHLHHQADEADGHEHHSRQRVHYHGDAEIETCRFAARGFAGFQSSAPARRRLLPAPDRRAQTNRR